MRWAMAVGGGFLLVSLLIASIVLSVRSTLGEDRPGLRGFPVGSEEEQIGRERGRRINEALQREAKRPLFSGTMAGLTFITPDQADTTIPCDGTISEVTGEQAKALVRGTELDIIPSYLPPFAGLYPARATAFVCADRVIGYGVDFGSVIISRGRLKGAHSFAPLDRMRETTIKGRPAVLIDGVSYLDPVSGREVRTPHAAVYINEEFGVTKIVGTYLDELIKVAEGLN